jgi:hypothetical protein
VTIDKRFVIGDALIQNVQSYSRKRLDCVTEMIIPSAAIRLFPLSRSKSSASQTGRVAVGFDSLAGKSKVYWPLLQIDFFFSIEVDKLPTIYNSTYRLKDRRMGSSAWLLL